MTQKEVASLLPKGDRNRVRDVERGDSLPNAGEILAYSVIFGSSVSEVFPDYYLAAEDAVMRLAYRLFKKLQKSNTSRSIRKRELLQVMLKRARKNHNRKKV